MLASFAPFKYNAELTERPARFRWLFKPLEFCQHGTGQISRVSRASREKSFIQRIGMMPLILKHERESV